MSTAKFGRRDFLRQTAAATLVAGVAGPVAGTFSTASAQQGGLKKAIQINMLPKDLPDADKFALAKKCGFEGIEAYPMDLDASAKLGETARAAGVEIHSVSYGGWDAPMSDSKEAVAEKGLKAIEAGLRSTKAMGAGVMLLVPAVVNEQVRYAEAYERSQANIRKVLPLAEELKVVVAVENVWNKFLLSPVEFARYVDEFDNPWLRAYFDTGNVVIFGYPQDWIRTLGKRIVRIHLKDFKSKGYEWKNLREGDVNWPEVRAALAEVGYEGYLTPELSGGDEAYLRDLSERIDLILAGK
jgi:L-ribulose-5-phosphate 3-epimerase